MRRLTGMMLGMDLDSMRVARELPELETVEVPTVFQGVDQYAGRTMNRRQRRAVAVHNRALATKAAAE